MPQLRPAGPDDLAFLRTMLGEAALWRGGQDRRSVERALADPHVARYLEGWGRPGDFGVVAEEEAEPVGAAWARFFTAEAPAYGFVDETVPDLALAVRPGHRGRGVGTALLGALLDDARERGLARLSLSVEQDNPALALYECSGFRRLALSGNAWTMVAELTLSR